MAHEYLTGQWWFATQEPLDLDPIPASDEGPSDSVPEDPTQPWWDDKSIPTPPPTGEDKPACVGCGDPNFSLESKYCIACRIGMGKGRKT